MNKIVRTTLLLLIGIFIGLQTYLNLTTAVYVPSHNVPKGTKLELSMFVQKRVLTISMPDFTVKSDEHIYQSYALNDLMAGLPITMFSLSRLYINIPSNVGSIYSETDILKHETNSALCVQYSDNSKPFWKGGSYASPSASNFATVCGVSNPIPSTAISNLLIATNNALCVQYTDNTKPTWDSALASPTASNAASVCK